MTDKAWRKYLEHHAEPLALHIAEAMPANDFDTVVAIPCYAEASLIQGCIDACALAAQYARQRTLLIVVVNAKDTDDASKFSDNEESLRLMRLAPLALSIEGASLHRQCEELYILSIDCNSAGKRFPATEGVGLARKLACDIAIAMKDRGLIRSKWLRNTDCDVRVPDTYFFDDGVDAACIVEPYAHQPQDKAAASWPALQEYEVWLRYYVAGLRFAKSPYAYHSIGSTMTTSFEAYAKVRGIPKRLAGEDFHYLNKVAKTGRIVARKAKPLMILDRPSDRVPFGTGAGVAKILGLREQSKNFPFYDPRCFHALKVFLTCLSEENDIRTLRQRFMQASQVDQRVADVLWSELRIDEGLLAISKNTKTRTTFMQQANDWFDALKTLRFIHLLRDHAFGSLEVFDACGQADFLEEAVRSKTNLTQLLDALRA